MKCFGKTPRPLFDFATLRANGIGGPFVLSPSTSSGQATPEGWSRSMNDVRHKWVRKTIA